MTEWEFSKHELELVVIAAHQNMEDAKVAMQVRQEESRRALERFQASIDTLNSACDVLRDAQQELAAWIAGGPEIS